MKKKLLMTAMVAALGGVGTAQAVHVNSDGHGQVLLYPYYTVQNGFDSYINLVNTTNKVKAVKVRFLEGKNSQEVLDFNLYLSPHDEWSGVIVKTTAGGAALKSNDTSCIAPKQLPAIDPAVTGELFRNYAYASDTVSTIARTSEGYVEVIEMGVVTDPASVAAATHGANGVPANCALIRTNASENGGLFNAAAGVNGIGRPEGGLYGFVTLINVNSGLKTTVDAVALDNFYVGIAATSDLHNPPGTIEPSLDAVDTAAEIIDGNAVVNYTTSRTLPIDHVSALLTRASISNDYAIDQGALSRNSKTDWVITFPTKRFYVQDAAVPVTPFTEKWTGSHSCDEISLVYFDREERQHVVTLADDDFSPPPPAPTVPRNTLCNEVNTLSIKPFNSGTSYKTLFGAEFTNASFTVEDAGFKAGWMELSFANVLPGSTAIRGLPVIGFAALSNENNTLVVNGVNVLSNYLGSTVHKGTRLIP